MGRLGVMALAFVGLVGVEVAVVIAVAGQIGAGWTLLAMLATALLGGWLLRREGARAWLRFRAAAAEGRPAGAEVTRGLVGMLSAVLLVLPGFLTDAVGLLLALPVVRGGAARLVRRVAERRLPSAAAGDLFGPRRVRVRQGTPGGAAAPAPPSVIEGEVLD